MDTRQQELQEKLIEIKKYEENQRIQLLVSLTIKSLLNFYRNGVNKFLFLATK